MWIWLAILAGVILGALVLLVLWSLLVMAGKGEEEMEMAIGCNPMPPGD